MNLRPEVIQVVPGTPTDMPKAPQRRSIGFIFVPRTRMDMPKAPQTQSIGVIFAALGHPTRLHGTPKLTLEGHPWTGWVRCGLRVSFSLTLAKILPNHTFIWLWWHGFPTSHCTYLYMLCFVLSSWSHSFCLLVSFSLHVGPKASLKHLLGDSDNCVSVRWHSSSPCLATSRYVGDFRVGPGEVL